MKTLRRTSRAPRPPGHVTGDAAQVFGWIDDLSAASIAEFDSNAEERPMLTLLSGEVFILGDSAIIRVR